MQYSPEVMDHFFNPRNVGELADATHTGMAKNPNDGDIARLWFKVVGGRIEAVSFKTMGCVVAIAATSKLTELVKGKSPAEALSLTKEQLTEALGGLPEQKVRCSLTCIEAMQAAFAGGDHDH